MKKNAKTENSKTDFVSAAARHRHDARLLLDARRPDNAKYLAGYVGECALKAVIAASGGDAKPFRHELSQLHGEGLTLAFFVSAASARYRPSPADVAALRDRWGTDLRYERTGVKPKNARKAIEHAEAVWLACIGQMYLDGRLEQWLDA